MKKKCTWSNSTFIKGHEYLKAHRTEDGRHECECGAVVKLRVHPGSGCYLIIPSHNDRRN
jgi:hypothetical protein